MSLVEPAAESRPHAAIWAWVLLATLSSLAACKDETCRGALVDGQCVPLCRDSDCEGDARCVDNQCAERCSADDECASGSCVRRRADNGERASFCRPGTSDASSAGDDDGDDDVGPEPQCSSSAECALDTGQRCVDGWCRQTCQVHAHCGVAGACTEDAEDVEGNAVFLCAADTFARGPGQYGSRCPNGNQDCAADFRCVSAGEGDADAYCAALGCDADDGCPAGFFCSHNRTSSPPCESACGLAGDPSVSSCVPREAIGEGRAFRCVDGGLELRICLQREYCSSCETDADCRSVPGQICATGGDGERICTLPCDPSTNSCPWGSASSCDVWDERIGLPTCGHRSGSCRGAGASCDPCLDDRDCPLGFCSVSGFSGEQFCVDETVVCACEADEASCQGGGCPETPGGLTMNCVMRADDLPPDACYGGLTVPTDPTSPLGCWPREAQSF